MTLMSTFSLLMQTASPSEHASIWSAEASIDGWLAFERALALSQASQGLMSTTQASAIVEAATIERIDQNELWESARLVGYPILGLVRQVVRAIPDDRAAGRVHYGATTQDVMDTAIALQMQRSLRALDNGLIRLGEALSQKVVEHQGTVMAARTHAQQAVPTTFGATLASLLEQVGRHRSRIADAGPRIEVVSMYGAGGTSAAYGASATQVRRGIADRLGLEVRDVSWHVDRDGVAEFGWLCATVAGTCAKLARNVIDLSRTEIGEVSERYSKHRGASSTMPQKINPISSENIIGLSATSSALTSALIRMQEAGHERSAGEWQIEWHVLPQLAELAGRALAEAADLVEGLKVDAERMRQNLEHDGGLVMAEAAMISLAPTLGQAGAHTLVYAAASRVRRGDMGFIDAVVAEASSARAEIPDFTLLPEQYLGDAAQSCDTAVERWRALPATANPPTNLHELALR